MICVLFRAAPSWVLVYIGTCVVWIVRCFFECGIEIYKQGKDRILKNMGNF